MVNGIYYVYSDEVYYPYHIGKYYNIIYCPAVYGKIS